MRKIELLFLALAAGCAGMMSPPAEKVPAPAADMSSANSPPVAAAPSKPQSGGEMAPPTGVAKAPTEKPAALPEKSPAKITASPKSPPKPPATPAPIAPVAPAVAKAPAAPHLDLKTLESRLKETNAIGTFTKIALKNQVDDLLGKFRAYHDGRQPPTLAELRQPYELLIMKVLSLLQKDDPALADDVARSRDVIWGVLSDKNKFTSI